MRQAAAANLGELGAWALPHAGKVAQLLQDTDPGVRLAAAAALRDLCRHDLPLAEQADALTRRAYDQDRRVWDAAVEVLDQLGDDGLGSMARRLVQASRSVPSLQSNPTAAVAVERLLTTLHAWAERGHAESVAKHIPAICGAWADQPGADAMGDVELRGRLVREIFALLGERARPGLGAVARAAAAPGTPYQAHAVRILEHWVDELPPCFFGPAPPDARLASLVLGRHLEGAHDTDENRRRAAVLWGVFVNGTATDHTVTPLFHGWASFRLFIDTEIERDCRSARDAGGAGAAAPVVERGIMAPVTDADVGRILGPYMRGAGVELDTIEEPAENPTGTDAPDMSTVAPATDAAADAAVPSAPPQVGSSCISPSTYEADYPGQERPSVEPRA